MLAPTMFWALSLRWVTFREAVTTAEREANRP
jgi:hypothetical protein